MHRPHIIPRPVNYLNTFHGKAFHSPGRDMKVPRAITVGGEKRARRVQLQDGEVCHENIEAREPMTRRELEELAAQQEIESIGVAPCEPLEDCRQEILLRQESGLIPVHAKWHREEVTQFCNPEHFLPGARSVIVATLCYLTGEQEEPDCSGTPGGAIAPYTRYNFYRALKEKLRGLARKIKRYYPDARSYVSSCGFLREKPLAALSGIGFYGSHGIIITKKWGSWVVLGTIVTTLELEHNEPLPDSCGQCSICREACPTGAITEPGVLHEGRCLQFLSEHEVLPVKYRQAWGKRLYGCAICQEVCPQNTGIPHDAAKPPFGALGPSVPLIPLLSIDEETMKEQFKGNQLGARWLSGWSLKKNAAVALGNWQDPAAVKPLGELLFNGPLHISEHAAWALSRIGGREARALLERALASPSLGALKGTIRTHMEF
ncbi:MAG: tRNA epoxyqueuosine(34) reductase QueG [Candidatus Eremiobacteraeota bacterium]|nr:tRNA epoxyqueuosine(34) reductase QueG [Candidatus Eremiobacteraeota bacterium]